MAKEGELCARGDTIRDAVNDLAFKRRKRKSVEKVVAKVKETGMVTPDDYRLITGACELGTQDFLFLLLLISNKKNHDKVVLFV